MRAPQLHGLEPQEEHGACLITGRKVVCCTVWHEQGSQPQVVQLAHVVQGLAHVVHGAYAAT